MCAFNERFGAAVYFWVLGLECGDVYVFMCWNMCAYILSDNIRLSEQCERIISFFF